MSGLGRDELSRRSRRNAHVVTGNDGELTNVRRASLILRPGDVIEYFSPAYIAGDRRALRIATIARIAQLDDPTYPIRINRFELLPLWTRLAVVDRGEVESSRDDERCYPSLRSYQLIDGSVDVSSQERDFNRGVGEAVAAARRAAHAAIDSEESCPQDEAYSSGDEAPDQMQYSGLERNESDATVSPHPRAMENIVRFENLLTEEQRLKKQHRAKNRLGLKQRSRRKHHQSMRKPGRRTQKVTHARNAESVFLKTFIQKPAIQLALQSLRNERAADQAAVCGTVAPEESASIAVYEGGEDSDEVNAIDRASSEGFDSETTGRAWHGAEHESSSLVSHEAPKTPIDWPAGVTRIYKKKNPMRVRFKDVGNLGMCECIGDCYIDECLNSRSDVYCTSRNCAVGGRCSNSLGEYLSLKLFKTPTCGIGVFTTEAIDVGTIIGEYCGVLEGYAGFTGANEEQVPKKKNSGYSLLLNRRASDGRFVYIEPREEGSIMRYVNHSCEPNCRFRQMQYRKQVVVAVVTMRKLHPMEELTVAYAGDLWFICKCNKCSNTK